VGVAATGPGASGSVISDCDFIDLAAGVNVFEGVPVIRRCRLIRPSVAGIYLHSGAMLEPGQNLGDVASAESGFNTFEIVPLPEKGDVKAPGSSAFCGPEVAHGKTLSSDLLLMGLLLLLLLVASRPKRVCH